MPELPEVETIVRGLRRRLAGRRISSACIAHPGILRDPGASLAACLESGTISEVRRFGKHILVGIRQAEPSARWLIIHLGMTGQLVVEPSSSPARPHTHAWLELENGESLRYTDIRRFGRVEISADEALPARLALLGPDPLEITEGEFITRVRSRAARLKSLLLDQHFVRGLGNIYADEILFRARLHPAAHGRRISRKRAADLWRSMREVLKEAIRHGGSSISDYIDASGQPGRFQRLHRVYGRAGQPCVNCGTRLRRSIIAGRGTTWCPKCQRAGSRVR